MTVSEMMSKLTYLKELASDVDNLANYENHVITVGDAEILDQAADQLRNYIEELGHKKVV